MAYQFSYPIGHPTYDPFAQIKKFRKPPRIYCSWRFKEGGSIPFHGIVLCLRQGGALLPSLRDTKCGPFGGPFGRTFRIRITPTLSHETAFNGGGSIPYPRYSFSADGIPADAMIAFEMSHDGFSIDR